MKIPGYKSRYRLERNHMEEITWGVPERKKSHGEFYLLVH